MCFKPFTTTGRQLDRIFQKHGEKTIMPNKCKDCKDVQHGRDPLSLDILEAYTGGSTDSVCAPTIIRQEPIQITQSLPIDSIDVKLNAWKANLIEQNIAVWMDRVVMDNTTKNVLERAAHIELPEGDEYPAVIQIDAIAQQLEIYPAEPSGPRRLSNACLSHGGSDLEAEMFLKLEEPKVLAQASAKDVEVKEDKIEASIQFRASLTPYKGSTEVLHDDVRNATSAIFRVCKGLPNLDYADVSTRYECAVERVRRTLDTRLIAVRKDRVHNFAREVGLTTPDFVELPKLRMIFTVVFSGVLLSVLLSMLAFLTSDGRFTMASYISIAVVGGYLTYIATLLFQRVYRVHIFQLAANTLVPDQVIGWRGMMTRILS